MWDMDYNCAYYVHSDTGESRWEPPLWVQEYDDSTGYYYYLNRYHAALSYHLACPTVCTLTQCVHVCAQLHWTIAMGNAE